MRPRWGTPGSVPTEPPGAASLGATILRLEYGYDPEGNRTSVVRTPRPSGGVVAGTRREQANAASLHRELRAIGALL